MLNVCVEFINESIYNIVMEELYMTVSEQIKVLCVRCNVSEAELARRLGKSPQSFNAKMKRESFTIDDLDKIAEAVGVGFKRNFILANGEEI